MEKSIEKLWNESLVKEEVLTVPILNNLYNQKSKSVLENIKKTYEMDNKSLLPMSIVLGLFLSYISQIIVGIYFATLIIVLFFYNKKLLTKFNKINIQNSNLTYLKSYRSIIREITKSTKKLLTYGIPLVFLFLLLIDYTSKEASFIRRYIPENHSIISIIMIGFLITILTSCIGLLAHSLSTKILYGTQLSKLDEIINDLDELNH